MEALREMGTYPRQCFFRTYAVLLPKLSGRDGEEEEATDLDRDIHTVRDRFIGMTGEAQWQCCMAKGWCRVWDDGVRGRRTLHRGTRHRANLYRGIVREANYGLRWSSASFP